MNTLKKVKKYNLHVYLSVLSLVLILSCGKKNEETSQQQKQETNSGKNEITSSGKISDKFVINYDLIGKMTGKMQIFREENKLKQNINSEIMGMANKNAIYIIDNSVYSVTEIGGKKFGMKTSLGEFNSQKQTAETIVNFKEFEQFLDSKKVTGNENILGYNCDIYDAGNGVFLYVYNKRYLLKMRTPEFQATATEINVNPTFAANEFELPKDVDFKNSAQKKFDKQALDSIVNKIKK